MKYLLMGFLLLLASTQADAQFFKKKKKPQPADSTVQAQPAVQRQAAAAAEEEFAPQVLTIDDMLEMMDKRTDSSFVRSKITKAGFNRRAIAEQNQVVYMGDTARGVTKYTEMVFVQTHNKEVQLLQFCTRHPEKVMEIRRALRSGRMFTGQPSLTADEEMSEGYYTSDYQILLESFSKKTRFVVSIWLKGAKLQQ